MYLVLNSILTIEVLVKDSYFRFSFMLSSLSFSTLEALINTLFSLYTSSFVGLLIIPSFFIVFLSLSFSFLILSDGKASLKETFLNIYISNFNDYNLL